MIIAFIMSPICENQWLWMILLSETIKIMLLNLLSLVLYKQMTNINTRKTR